MASSRSETAWSRFCTSIRRTKLGCKIAPWTFLVLLMQLRSAISCTCPSDSEIASIDVDVAGDKQGQNRYVQYDHISLPYDPTGPSQRDVLIYSDSSYIESQLEILAFDSGGTKLSYTESCCWEFAWVSTTTQEQYVTPNYDQNNPNMIASWRVTNANQLDIQSINMKYVIKHRLSNGSELPSSEKRFYLKVQCQIYDARLEPPITKFTFNKAKSPVEPFEQPFRYIFIDDQGNEDTRPCLADKPQYRYQMESWKGPNLSIGFDESKSWTDSHPTKIYTRDETKLRASPVGINNKIRLKLRNMWLWGPKQSDYLQIIDIEIVQFELVTPINLNNLPFGPQDILGLGFSFEATYSMGDADKEFREMHGQNETYLLDNSSCVFFTRFHLEYEQDDGGWLSSCGSEIRMTRAQLDSLGLSTSDSNQLISAYDHPYTTSYWSYSTGSSWQDSQCNPAGASKFSKSFDISSGQDFGVIFSFHKDYLPNKRIVRLKQTFSSADIISSSVIDSQYDTGEYKITFKSSANTFASPNGFQFLGTQGDRLQVNSGKDIHQFGIYYRTRSCSQDKIGSNKVCFGSQLASLLHPQKYISKAYVELGKATIYIATDRAQILSRSNCLVFQPTVSLSIVNQPAWLTVDSMKFEFMDEYSQIELSIQSSQSSIACRKFNLSANIQHLATSIAKYDYYMKYLTKVHILSDCYASSFTIQQLEIDVSGQLSNSISLKQDVWKVSFQDSILQDLTSTDGQKVSIEAKITDDTGGQHSPNHDCCIEWRLISADDQQFWTYVEPVTSPATKMLTQLNFVAMKDLPEGNHTLLLKAITPTHRRTVNGYQVPWESNELTITVAVQPICDPAKYVFKPALPENYDISYGSVLPEVSLPLGFYYQLQNSDGSADLRPCLTEFAKKLVWTVSTTSSYVEIDYQTQELAPTKILPVWKSNLSSLPPENETIPVKIEVIHLETGTVLLSHELTLTLKCSFSSQAALVCPKENSLSFKMTEVNAVKGLEVNNSIDLCRQKIKYECSQVKVAPSTVSYDICKTSWFDQSTLIIPSSNNTADFENSNLEHPAVYTVQLSASLNQETKSCPSIDISVDLLDCSLGSSYASHTKAIREANITAAAPAQQKYFMGDPALTVTFAEFRIGLCKIAGYTVQYKSLAGEILEPKSISFDQNKRQFTIQSEAGKRDIIPADSQSIDIVVKVTGTAGPSLSTSVQFLVTLESLVVEQDFIQDLIDGLQPVPYLERENFDSSDQLLEIELMANQTIYAIDLGQLVYDGDPADQLSVIIPESKVNFAQVLQNSDDNYLLFIDLELGGSVNVTYECSIKVSILQKNRETREETISVKFILITVEDDSEIPDEKVEESQNSATGTNNTNETATSQKFSPEGFQVQAISPEVREQIQQINQQVKKPSIAKITHAGNVKVNFGKLRVIESEEDLLNYQRRKLDKSTSKSKTGIKIPPDYGNEVTRIYATEKTGKEVHGFSLYVEPDEMSLPDQLNFSYEVKNFDYQELDVQINFEQTRVVSTNQQPEYVVIQLNDFRDLEGGLIIEEHEMRKAIPAQVDQDIKVAVELAGDAASGAVGAQFSFNLVVNLIVGQSLNSMLSGIKNLQVIVHLTLVNVVIPAVAQIFFARIFEIIAFDPIDMQDQLIDYFELDGDAVPHNLSPNFEQLGYESSYLILNMGSMLLLWVIEFAQIPLYAMLYLLSHFCCKDRCLKKSKHKLRGIFWNQLLALIDGTFLVIIVMAIINIRDKMSGDAEINSSYWLSLIVICAGFLEIINVACFLYIGSRDTRQLDEQKNKKKCGYTYEQLQYSIRGRWILVYPVISQMRLLVIAFATISMKETVVLQILLLSLSNVFFMAFVGMMRPLRNSGSQVFDEFVAILVLDMLLFCSNPTIDVDMRFYIGWFLIAILTLSIIVNQGSLFVQSILNLKQKCMKKWRQHLLKKGQKDGEPKQSQVDNHVENVETRAKDFDSAQQIKRVPQRPRIQIATDPLEIQTQAQTVKKGSEGVYESKSIDISSINLKAMHFGALVPKPNQDDMHPANVFSAQIAGPRLPVSRCDFCKDYPDGQQCFVCMMKDTDLAENSQQRVQTSSKGCSFCDMIKDGSKCIKCRNKNSEYQDQSIIETSLIKNDCLACKLRSDGSKCVLCAINDDAQQIMKKNLLKRGRPVQTQTYPYQTQESLQQDSLQISVVEEELEEYERHTQKLTSSQLQTKGHFK